MEDKPVTIGPLKSDSPASGDKPASKKKDKAKEVSEGPYTYSFSYWGR